MEALVLSAYITVILLLLEIFFLLFSILMRSSISWFTKNNKWSYLDWLLLSNYQHDAKFKQMGEIKLSFWTGENFLWMLMTFPQEKTFLPLPSMHCLYSRDICCDSILLDHEEKQRGISAKTIYTLEYAEFRPFSQILKQLELLGIC